jgi:hypothetical protein
MNASRDANKRRPIISGPSVCADFQIGPRTRRRWEGDPEMGFPQPLDINGRKYYYVDEIEEFKMRRRVTAETTVSESDVPQTSEPGCAEIASSNRSEKAARKAAGHGNLRRGRPRNPVAGDATSNEAA